KLTENDTLSWSKLFSHNLVKIKSKLTDLLGPSLDNLEDEIVDEKVQQETYDNEEKIRLDWMILSEMGPNAIVDSSSDLACNRDDINAENSVPNIVDCYTLNKKQLKIFK
ncbi:26750_t:CDS:2, partial [Racocetra persica]